MEPWVPAKCNSLQCKYYMVCLFCSEIQFYITAISVKNAVCKILLQQHLKKSSPQLIMDLLTVAMMEIILWKCSNCSNTKGETA